MCGKALSQPTGGRKCFPSVCQILKHGFLHYSNKQTFLIGKNVLIVMSPILINKDVFEPSYNDLKFSLKPQLYLHQLKRNCLKICTMKVFLLTPW